MVRKYEIMYILDQDTTEVKDIQSKLHAILETNGGKIIESSDWGLKNFAYEINRKEKGYYTVLITETSSENINEFQRIAKIDKNVVRVMVINTESEKRYEQTTKLSKTDMTKYKEEKRAPKPFEKRFNREGYKGPNTTPTSSEQKVEKIEKEVE
ncbi:30S ribosomal protein S6 [Spiroplasma sabaudiense Ar-1343]|uniref:Small ribosomal subunit protein bS6 n=1 Tax=Spiroplasma sabaudiense Ar-1343 TaxID=1276257 RepID=W6A8E2_9MOLU|nr:30S ribosomal protein S6 [Spiroplasma sabaudiense]AHI53433.1 30S ribosomal protein S6 [Spiroplasma sabaudiense Ar-1343]